MAIDLLQLNSLTQKVLGKGQITTFSTPTVLYTVPANTVAVLKTGLIGNQTSSSGATLTLWIIASGEPTNGSTLYLNSFPLPGADAFPLDFLNELRLEAGAKVMLQCTGAFISYILSGYEIA